MLVAFGQSADDWVCSRPDFGWTKHSDSFLYSLSPVDHLYEDERYIVLADTTLDKASMKAFEQGVGQLLDCYVTGITDYELFLGTYFIVLFDKTRGELFCFRDPSGIKTGYFFLDDFGILVGTLIHDVASVADVHALDEEALHQILATYYLQDGFTFYEGIKEFTIGSQLAFDRDMNVVRNSVLEIDLAKEDNDNTFEENTALLRREITSALHRHSCRDNIVLLSGGIDSVVMLAALNDLDDGSRLRAATYRVTGTDQDETVYARDIAEHLKCDCETIDSDPLDCGIYDRFEETILKMNNPYYGVWVFGDLVGASLTNKFFAGQDTRLHTPDMNFFDRAAYAIFALRTCKPLDIVLGAIDVLVRPVKGLDLNNHPSRIMKGIGRLFELFDTSGYLRKFVFKCDRDKFKKTGLQLQHLAKIEKLFHLDTSAIRNRRELYNEVTKIRWKTQFINNIRYLDDLAKLNSTYLAVPFYDAKLSIVSSGLPLRQATRVRVGRAKYSQKKALVDKYMLRMAFRDKLTETIFNRQKAVSMTLHLLMENELGRKVTDILTDDLRADGSFLKRYGFDQYVSRNLGTHKWRVADFKYLYNITYLAAFCVYDRRVLGNNSHGQTHAVRKHATCD